jgi:hypothetical protein
MSRGKYLSLEEARKKKQLEQFSKEHPSEGDKTQFDQLFQAMAKPALAKGRKAKKTQKGGATSR